MTVKRVFAEGFQGWRSSQRAHFPPTWLKFTHGVMCGLILLFVLALVSKVFLQLLRFFFPNENHYF